MIHSLSKRGSPVTLHEPKQEQGRRCASAERRQVAKQPCLDRLAPRSDHHLQPITLPLVATGRPRPQNAAPGDRHIKLRSEDGPETLM